MENNWGESMTELIGKVVKELVHVFDVLSVKILENRKRIMALETRIKELENKWSQKNVNSEIIKYMVFHISDTLMLMQMELDVHLNHGK